MSAGRRDQRIAFQAATAATDAQGSAETTWGTAVNAWAHVTNTAAKETREGNAEVAEAEYRFNVRYHSGLATLDGTSRLTWKGSIFNIQTFIPTPEGRPSEINITARKRAA